MRSVVLLVVWFGFSLRLLGMILVNTVHVSYTNVDI